MVSAAEARQEKMSARRLVQSLGASVLRVAAVRDNNANDWYVRVIVVEDIPDHMKDQLIANGVRINVVPAHYLERLDHAR